MRAAPAGAKAAAKPRPVAPPIDCASVLPGLDFADAHTVAGGDAERLYVRNGWQRCGEIPNYALWPDGQLCATTVYFEALG
jgi:hypothetical protein